MSEKILLLGSGELGKELVISLKRYGCYVVACDSYAGAPAMQVADEYEVFNMLDAKALDAAVAKHEPRLIVPEVESIRTERFYDYEKQGMTVVPSAKAANFTMNRKLIRDLAAKELGIRTANYRYAQSLEEFKKAAAEIGMPCVVKPLMSSSGKGQSVLREAAKMEEVWNYALEGSRGDLVEVIVEGFVDFHTEITLLTVTQQHGPTLFCPAIGHRQERGDYQESWQPCVLDPAAEKEAQEMAAAVTKALGGAGIWGVEFFIADDGVYFSELSPRPHDTGMVTLSGCQGLNEFELHARSILGYPIPGIKSLFNGVSSVVLATKHSDGPITYQGMEEVLKEENTEVRIFGKPTSRPYRRMAVVLSHGHESTDTLREKGARLAAKIRVI